jgi:hypothetical protein
LSNAFRAADSGFRKTNRFIRDKVSITPDSDSVLRECDCIVRQPNSMIRDKIRMFRAAYRVVREMDSMPPDTVSIVRDGDSASREAVRGRFLNENTRFSPIYARRRSFCQ